MLIGTLATTHGCPFAPQQKTLDTDSSLMFSRLFLLFESIPRSSGVTYRRHHLQLHIFLSIAEVIDPSLFEPLIGSVYWSLAGGRGTWSSESTPDSAAVSAHAC